MLEHFPNLNLRPQTGTELLTVIDNKNEMKDRSKSRVQRMTKSRRSKMVDRRRLVLNFELLFFSFTNFIFILVLRRTNKSKSRENEMQK